MMTIKIQVIQREFKSSGSYSRSYKICDCKYCCDGIKKLPLINFCFEYTENTDNPLEDDYGYGKDLGVMLLNETVYHDAWDYDDYGYEETYYYKLNYCPICGEKIVVEIVDNVDLTNEYELLVKERDEVHRKINKTDSIKKREELIKSRVKLDNKIESFYHTDRLPTVKNIDEYDEEYE